MSDHDPVEEHEVELAEAEEEVGFDLGVDVAQPQAPYGEESFDIVNDLGYGNGPRE
jgi:hypothetical protein